MATDLEIAFKALQAKQEPYNKLWDYYDGNHPLVYSTRRLREVFRGLDAVFSENWCATVVDAALERIQLQQFAVGNDQAATDALNALWKATEMDLDLDDAHLAMLVCGEAFVIVWPNEAGETEAYYNDPRLCHVVYDAENPRKKAFAAKWWRLRDNHYRLTLYYSDRLEYYQTSRPTQGGAVPNSAKAFVRMDPDAAENPYGAIPVFHLRRERRTIVSELKNVLPLQAAVNKLLADMMISAEFGAFKQRWIITNADTDTLKNAPNEIWTIPAGDGLGEGSSVGQFDETSLGNFITAIDHLVNAISSTSRTPKHFFFQQGGAPSGEALITEEAPLNKKCRRYINRSGNTLQHLAAFMLRLQGITVGPEEITPVFANPETVQPRTRAEIREIRVRAGEPLTYVMRDQGASEADLEQMQADKRRERAEAQASLAQALIEQQRRFDRDQEE